MSFFEQQDLRINKQFISIFDSVYFVSEHGKGSLQQAFELITGPFLRKQTYLLLITPHSVKAVYVCSSNEHSQYKPFVTFESIVYELKECLDYKSIGTGNPIYKLGFGKKRFVEQLLNLGMKLEEQIIFNTESPDITHAEHENESDELAKNKMSYGKRYSDKSELEVMEEVIMTNFQIQKHWFQYKIPKWLSVINSIQEFVCNEKGLRSGNYSYYTNLIENEFLRENLTILSEFGIPSSAIRKLEKLIPSNMQQDEVIKSIRENKLYENSDFIEYERNKLKET